MNTRSVRRYFILTAFSVSLISCAAFDQFIGSQRTSTHRNISTLHPKHYRTGRNFHGQPMRYASFSEVAILTESRDPNATGNLWKRLQDGLQMPYSERNPQIQAQINWFLSHESYLDRTARSAAPYMYLIYDQVQQRNLPTELVLLPILESAYYPLAYSSAGAAGIWQLMPGTASKFGLKRDIYYDGRRDVFASTNAALDYLTYLQNYFDGDWLLAMAAYDSGEGTVQEAIRRNIRLGKNTDFWSLDLPRETRSYVPRLLALADIIKHQDQYPRLLPIINDQPYLGQVDISTKIKLSDAAKLAGMSVNELKLLNPGYRRVAINPEHKMHKLLLPIEKIEDFRDNLAILPKQVEITWNESTDTEDQSVTKNKNTKKHRPTKPPIETFNKKLKHKNQHYIIRPGDTLQKIAHHLKVPVKKLKMNNHIRSEKQLRPGQILIY